MEATTSQKVNETASPTCLRIVCSARYPLFGGKKEKVIKATMSQMRYVLVSAVSSQRMVNVATVHSATLAMLSLVKLSPQLSRTSTWECDRVVLSFPFCYGCELTSVFPCLPTMNLPHLPLHSHSFYQTNYLASLLW